MPTPETFILRELLNSEKGWVSGAALATSLGVSRVAVWHHMEKLRIQGFAFEARRARGYRLAAPPERLHAALIELQLKVRQRAFTFEVLDEVDSTNDEAARLLATGRATPFAVFAQSQTQGRGRFGRSWHSEENGNLYASFAFRPKIAPEDMASFTLWMGLGICELISNFAHITPGIKWPNDILFDGRKAGGILTEARVDADHVRDLVFGLGLNVNSPPKKWPGDLEGRAVSLAEIAGAPLDLNRFTAAITGRVLLAYERFADGEYRKTFAELWNRYDVLRGREVAVLEGGRRHVGTVTGIDDHGALLLRDAQGRRHHFRAGEVSLEKSE